MKAKKYMLQVRKINRILENKANEAAQWRLLAMSVTAAPPPDTGVRVQSSGDKQRMASAIIAALDVQEQISAAIAEQVAKRQEIIAVIEQLPEVEYDVLHKMYIGTAAQDGHMSYYTLDDVARAYDRSYAWAKGIHGRALADVQRIVDAVPQISQSSPK